MLRCTFVFNHLRFRLLLLAYLLCSVNITFVNFAGARTSLPGKVGDSLYSLAKRYKYDFMDGEKKAHPQSLGRQGSRAMKTLA
jgi:hypothetical protein